MGFDQLSGRERDILRVLIDHYISTAEPVGSRVLSTRHRLGLSPATIRNTMQDLEEMGLIEQRHTSAGRIPTQLGLRFFVDSLLEVRQLSPQDQESLATLLKTGRKAEAVTLATRSRAMTVTEASGHVDSFR